MTITPPDIRDITTEPTPSLISECNYQCSPGVHTYVCGTGTRCGHMARGVGWCGDCLDRELLRRGIDVTKGGSQYAYERVEGRLRRKIKGRAG